MGASGLPDRWDGVLDTIVRNHWRPRKLKTCLLFAALVYFIWQERDGRLFKGVIRDINQLATEICRMVYMISVGAANRRGTVGSGGNGAST